MPTPQDDNFSGPTLDSKWTFYPTSPGGNGSYSFLTNPGNITISVPADADIFPPQTVDTAVSLRQPQVAPQFFVEAGFTSTGVIVNAQESGVFIAKTGDPTTFVALVKTRVSGVSKVRAGYFVSGVLTSVNEVSFNDDTNIVLRIQRYGGSFQFFYKKEENISFSQLALATADGFGATEFGLIGSSGGGTPFDILVNYFHARTLADIAVQADVLLRVGNTVVTLADMLLSVRNYPPARHMAVHQHFETPVNTLYWDDGVLFSPTLASPGGVPWTIFVADDGAFGTLPGVDTPLDSVYILDVLGNVWEISVADDGAVILTPAFDVDPAETVLILATSPDLSRHYFIITYLDPFNPLVAEAAITTYPTTLDSSGIIIVRKEGSFPKTPTDGTVIYVGASLNTFDDGPLQSRARQFYSIFTVYSDKVSAPATMATMPVFVNFYRDIGHRFARKFHGGVWWMLYSIAKVVQSLVDIDIPAALGQFNIKSASGTFLELWGKLFGGRRYPGESDSQFSDRVISRVLLGRTVPSVIRSEVLKIPGVVYCEINDSTSGSMFIGYSFIGFAGTVENPEQSCFIEPIFYENPFFFTVRVKIKQGTNLDQIIKTVQDNKAAGTRFVVEILEILP